MTHRTQPELRPIWPTEPWPMTHCLVWLQPVVFTTRRFNLIMFLYNIFWVQGADKKSPAISSVQRVMGVTYVLLAGDLQKLYSISDLAIYVHTALQKVPRPKEIRQFFKDYLKLSWKILQTNYMLSFVLIFNILTKLCCFKHDNHTVVTSWKILQLLIVLKASVSLELKRKI